MSESCTKVMFANTERYCSLLLWRQVEIPVFNSSAYHLVDNAHAGHSLIVVPWPYS